jgi:glycosyltransferase involved in cell wall biosynthesis
MSPKVSFVMPMYNGAATVRRAIESVRAQTFDDWELLVVDDVSTDDSRELVRGIISETADARISLVERGHNGGGPGPGRNTGFDASRGDFIAFLDCDDEILPQFLDTLLPLVADPDVDVAVAAHIARTASGKDTPRPDRTLGIMTGVAAVDAIMQNRMWNYTHAKLYRRSVLDVVRNREETIRYEDLVFNACVFSYSRKISVVDTPVHVYYIAPSSVTWSQEPTMAFALATQQFIRDGVNPAVASEISTDSWTTLRVTLNIVTLSGALATRAAKPAVDRLTSHLRSDVSLHDVARVLPIAPVIAISAALAQVSPAVYGMLYRAYVRRSYDMAA